MGTHQEQQQSQISTRYQLSRLNGSGRADNNALVYLTLYSRLGNFLHFSPKKVHEENVSHHSKWAHIKRRKKIQIATWYQLSRLNISGRADNNALVYQASHSRLDNVRQFSPKKVHEENFTHHSKWAHIQSSKKSNLYHVSAF